MKFDYDFLGRYGGGSGYFGIKLKQFKFKNYFDFFRHSYSHPDNLREAKTFLSFKHF